MSESDSNKPFSGSVAQIYEKYLVPLIFESYATDLVGRLASGPVERVLEIAAGTGVVTRRLASTLPESVSIVASDISQPMLDVASATGTSRPVEWRQADAMNLPFRDESFDAVICQFGSMFFPDKAKAFSEMRRVLTPGGRLIFSVWDRLEENEFADAVTAGLKNVFPDDPPRFLPRVPYGYYDTSIVERDLAGGGFTASPQITTIAARSLADSPRIPAIAFCQGSPVRGDIEARDPSRFSEAIDAAAAEVARRFGSGPVDGKIQAHIISINN